MEVGEEYELARQETSELIQTNVGTKDDVSSDVGVTLWARIKNITTNVIAILSHLTTNLSATRSAKIDNLDVTVSTRATQASVNLLQTEANALSRYTADTTLANGIYNAVVARATQTSVTDLQTNVINRLGDTTNTGATTTTGTLYGKANAILANLGILESDANALARYNGLISYLESSEVNAASRYNSVVPYLQRGSVKSVQRGFLATTTNIPAASYIDIPISSVVVGKASFSNSFGLVPNYTSFLGGVFEYIIYTNYIRVYNRSNSGQQIAGQWELTEYY